MTILARARPTPELFEAVRDHFGLSWDGDVRDCGGVNLNVHLPTGGDGHIARVYAPWTSSERLTAIQSVRASLVEAGLPFVPSLRTVSGAGFFEHDGRVVEVEPFRAGENMTIEQLPIGARMLAQVHDVLRTVDAHAHPEARDAAHPNHIDADLALAWTRAGAEAIRTERVSDDELRTADASEELAELLRPLELAATLPKQLVHGDFWDNNVLFVGDEVRVLLDLDFMGCRPRIDDLALTLYYTNSTLAMDGRDAERLTFSAAIVHAYADALTHPLSDDEQARLPLALARTILCFIGMVPLIDKEESRRRHVRLSAPDIAWSLDIVRNLERWRDAFSRPR